MSAITAVPAASVLATFHDRLAQVAAEALDVLVGIVRGKPADPQRSREARLAACQILRLACSPAVARAAAPQPAPTVATELAREAATLREAQANRRAAVDTLRLLDRLGAERARTPIPPPRPPQRAPISPPRAPAPRSPTPLANAAPLPPLTSNRSSPPRTLLARAGVAT